MPYFMFNTDEGWPFYIPFWAQSGESRVVIATKGRTYWVQLGRALTWWDNIIRDVVVEGELLHAERHIIQALLWVEAFYRETNNKTYAKPFLWKIKLLSYYTISEEGRLRKTANAFGMSRAWTFIIITRVTQEITVHISPCHRLKLLSMYGVPQCLSAIDATHIEIKEPLLNATDYIKHKGWALLNVQACCDYQYFS